MRLTSITITDLAAFKGKNTFTLPAVALITGKHGSGKSSLESTLMYLLGRRPLAGKGSRSVQHDPSILHGTCEKGEALVTFDEGPLEFLRVVVKPDKTTREVKTRGAKKWEDAGQLIDDITSALSYNPMVFKDLSEKERLEAFLRVVPVEISAQEVIDAVGGAILLSLTGTPGLDTINSLHEDIYKARTFENTEADSLAKHAAELEKALPMAPESGDWNAEATAMRAEKAVLEESEQEEIRRIGKDLQGKKDAAASTRRDSDATVDKVLFSVLDEIEAKVRDLETQRHAAKSDAARTKTTYSEAEAIANETARNFAKAEVVELRANNEPLHQALLTKIATADERSRASAQAEGTRIAAETARAGSETRKAKAKEMTEALTRLTALKAVVGGRMKVKGVEIASPRAGQPVDICRMEDGALVPFSRWNDADADAFCLRMAVLFRGPCGLVCVDNMGNWSPARQEMVIARCRELSVEHKMQFLLGRSCDTGSLTVEDITEEPNA